MANTVGNDIIITSAGNTPIQANIACWILPLNPALGPYFRGAVQGKPGSLDEPGAAEAFGFWNAPEGPGLVRVTMPGHETQDITTTFPCNLKVTMRRHVPTKLRAEGLRMFNAHGEYRWAMISGYRAYQRFLVGEHGHPARLHPLPDFRPVVPAHRQDPHEHPGQAAHRDPLEPLAHVSKMPPTRVCERHAVVEDLEGLGRRPRAEGSGGHLAHRSAEAAPGAGAVGGPCQTLPPRDAPGRSV